MSTEVTWQTKSTSSEQTEELAAKLGAALRGGEVIELVSDLGGGKTTFVRGLARGAGSSNTVSSPSFTVNKIYNTDKFDIHHFDFYRLPEPGIVANELAEVVGDEKIVAVVEWADSVQDVLPAERLTVTIIPTPNGDRMFKFHAPADLEHLVKAVQ